MVTVENNAGRLIEVRQTGKVTMEEIQASFPNFARILGSSPEPFIMVTDWRGMRVLDAQTSEFLLGIMRDKNDRISKQALLMSPNAVLGLQVRRLFSEAGGQSRDVFESSLGVTGWLASELTLPESRALKRFLDAGTVH